MTTLFSDTEFANYLHLTAAVDSTTVERIAWGWLMNATRLTTRPTPVPDDMFGWALELAAIAYYNPAAAANESEDDYSVSNDRQRRKEILDAARATYGTSARAQYSFPAWDWSWTVTPVTTNTTTT